MALTAIFVQKVKHKGRSNPDGKSLPDKHAHANGMYLYVTASAKYWRYDYQFLGKRKTLAMGVYPLVSLKDAVQKHTEARKLLDDGIDPMAAKLEVQAIESAKQDATFEKLATEWLNTPNKNRGPRTQQKIARWFQVDVFPFIGAMPIATINAQTVLTQVLRHTEAADTIDKTHRIKQACSQVFRFAVVKGLVERDPLSDLKEALATKRAVSHAAITEPTDLGKLLRAINGYHGHPTTKGALLLSPLVFVRPGELRHAEWAEIDLQAREWRIPASKMKMNKDHMVPLASQAIELLEGLQALTGHGRYVFPSTWKNDRPMSENTINSALTELGYGSGIHTGHGFRATARTIMDEVLGERVALIEHQLAHAVKDANGTAYNRTSHLPARRLMMQRWADYLDGLKAGAQVLPFKGAA